MFKIAVSKNQKERKIGLFRKLTQVEGRFVPHCCITTFDPTNENQRLGECGINWGWIIRDNNIIWVFFKCFYITGYSKIRRDYLLPKPFEVLLTLEVCFRFLFHKEMQLFKIPL